MNKRSPENSASPQLINAISTRLRSEQRLYALLQIPKTPQFSPDGKNTRSGLQPQKPRNVRK